MLGLLRLFALGFLSTVIAQSSSCPYYQYSRTFTFYPYYCNQAGALLCVVDSQCKVVPGTTYTIADVSKDFTQADVIVVKSRGDYVDGLPLLTSNVYIQFYENGIKRVGDLTTSQATILDFEGNVGISYENSTFPKTVTRISVARNGLTELPKTIPYSQLVEFYAWENNFTAIQNVDFRLATEVKLSKNEKLVSLSNVSFSSKLQKLYFDKSWFTTFLIDQATYNALLYVPTFQVAGIDVSASCVSPNKAMPLKTYTVCVMSESTAPSDGNGTTSKTSSNTGAIIGGIVGGLVALGGIAWFVMKRRHSANDKDGSRYPTGQQTQSYKEMSTDYASTINIQELTMIRLDEGALIKKNVLAKGAYGEVWLGEYKGEPVAIKCLLPGKNSHVDVKFLAEEILLTSKLESAYIVRTLGACWVTPSALEMVVEWMNRGDLKNVLEATKPANPTESSTSFSWIEKCECLLSIVDGLSYLHSMDIIHRDLKSRNILMDVEKGTKLTDFGTAREATNETMTIGVGTYRWMAPEVLRENYYTVAADMYSLGMVIAELSTHHIPYVDMTNGKGKALVDTAIMSMVIQNEIQPTISPSCPPWIRELAIKCFAFEPEDRPTAFQVSALIRQHMKFVGDNGQGLYEL